MNKALSRSVGHSAWNRFEDVRLVQYLLNCVPVSRGGPTHELEVDGVCGPLTLRAIFRFKRFRRGSARTRAEPNRQLFHALLTHDPYPSQSLPPACHGSGQPSAVTARTRLRRLGETTAFVRDVVLPGGPDARPVLNAAACFVALRYARSPIHRWGIFAAEPIAAGRRVIEYTGERVSPQEAARRTLRSQLYLFYVSPTQQIDGAIGGSGAEYINHSCEPNLRAAVSRRRLYLLSLRAIEAGEELLLDYRINADGPHIQCQCGAPRCRGYLNMTEQL